MVKRCRAVGCIDRHIRGSNNTRWIGKNYTREFCRRGQCQRFIATDGQTVVDINAAAGERKGNV